MSEALLLLEVEAEVLEMTEPSSEERLEVTRLDTADTLALELQTKVHTKVRNQSRRKRLLAFTMARVVGAYIISSIVHGTETAGIPFNFFIIVSPGNGTDSAR